MAVPSGSTPSTREAANGPAGWPVTRRAAITAAPEQASSGAITKLGRPARTASTSHQGQLRRFGPETARDEVTGMAQSGEAGPITAAYATCALPAGMYESGRCAATR